MSKVSDFNELIKQREATTTASPFAIIRLDGRGFSKLTAAYFNKPVDLKFHNAMVEACNAIFYWSGIKIAYIQYHSDEISVLIANDDTTFGRNVQKYITVLSSLVASVLTRHFNVDQPIMVDGRLHQAESVTDVLHYFKWRQRDAERNALNTYCYWTLVNSGLSKKKADNMMRLCHGNPDSLKALIDQYSGRKIAYDKLEGWVTNVTAFYWVDEPHFGYNPITQEKVETTRRAVMRVDNLEGGDKFKAFISGVVRDVI